MTREQSKGQKEKEDVYFSMLLVDAIQGSNVIVGLIDYFRRAHLLPPQEIHDMLRGQRESVHWIVLIRHQTRWLEEWIIRFEVGVHQFRF